MTPANAIAIRSRCASSAVSSRSSGSQVETSARGSDAQKPASARHARSDVHELGVEPLAAAARRDRARGVGTALAVEDLRRLRQADDAREQRDLVAAQAQRLPVAVPVLVERADRVRGPGLEPEQERDLGAAVAAREHQRARDLALVLDRLQPVGAGAQRTLGATVRSDHRNAGTARDQFERLAVRLASWSSASNSAAILAAFAVHPASFISSA